MGNLYRSYLLPPDLEGQRAIRTPEELAKAWADSAERSRMGQYLNVPASAEVPKQGRICTHSYCVGSAYRVPPSETANQVLCLFVDPTRLVAMAQCKEA